MANYLVIDGHHGDPRDKDNQRALMVNAPGRNESGSDYVYLGMRNAYFDEPYKKGLENHWMLLDDDDIDNLITALMYVKAARHDPSLRRSAGARIESKATHSAY